MATQVQFRRGTTSQIASFAGAQAEVVVDVVKKTCVVCDGSTPGGYPLMREDGTNSSLSPGSLNSCALKFANNAGTGLISLSPGSVSLVANGIESLTATDAGDLFIPGNTTANGYLSLFGSFSASGPIFQTAPLYHTSDFAVNPGDPRHICNGTGIIHVTLPDSNVYNGMQLLIKTVTAYAVVSDASNVVPLAGGSAGTAILSATPGKWALLASNDDHWDIMCGN